MNKLFLWPHRIIMKLQCLDFLAPLALRLFLVPVFWVSGMTKLANINDVAQWFGQGLGLPFPTVMAYLATFTELAGAICLAVGLGVRFIVVPLIVVMLVAVFTVHIDHGWAAIASQKMLSTQRLDNLLDWLREHYPARYKYATELGEPVVLNNGVQFAVTYIIMLLTLFFTGAGKYFSIDYWIGRFYCSRDKGCM